jgi:hypothetical protein
VGKKLGLFAQTVINFLANKKVLKIKFSYKNSISYEQLFKKLDQLMDF